MMTKVIRNPDMNELKRIAAKMSNASRTEWGNYNVSTRVTARLNEYTFIVSDRDCARPNICRADYEKVAILQDDYLRKHDLIEVTGAIGLEKPVRAPASLLVETSAGNIAAMQSQLCFQSDANENPVIKVIYTPNLKPQILSLPTLIAVDLDNYTTRILGTDYFGESKKAGLRMWNKWVYDQGGLALHAGCKTYFNALGKEKAVIIIGLSGTGKTTTTFNSNLGSLPVQDDFCALFPDGRLFASENGCFAKTYGLDEAHEPVIYNALKHPTSWLENVSVNGAGRVDYYDGSITTNGRGTFTLDKIEHRDPANLPEVSHIIILNRNFDIIPGIVLLKPEQSAEYFMLGETTGTSAGGAAEAGKFLRVPGTNPFFFTDDVLQGDRFSQVLKNNPEIKVALMNTGCIGGQPGEPTSIKVKIAHSSALLEALLRDEIDWLQDEDFDYLVTAKPVKGCPKEITDPKSYYLENGKAIEYGKTISNLITSRKNYIKQLPDLSEVNS